MIGTVLLDFAASSTEERVGQMAYLAAFVGGWNVMVPAWG
jgi:hypothetical protein